MRTHAQALKDQTQTAQVCTPQPAKMVYTDCLANAPYAKIHAFNANICGLAAGLSHSVCNARPGWRPMVALLAGQVCFSVLQERAYPFIPVSAHSCMAAPPVHTARLSVHLVSPLDDGAVEAVESRALHHAANCYECEYPTSMPRCAGGPRTSSTSTGRRRRSTCWPPRARGGARARRRRACARRRRRGSRRPASAPISAKSRARL